MNKPFTGQTLEQRVAEMRSELHTSILYREQHDFIENFDGDLLKLLDDIENRLAQLKPSTAGAA